MADVFISYKREDKARAQHLVEALKAEGFSTWWDDRISVAEHWDEVIEREIRDARAVIVLWTPDSVRSAWVRTEAEFAKGANKLAPVTLAPCQPPLAFLLVQAVDLTRWSGDREDRNWLKLTAWVRDLLAGVPPATEEALAPKGKDWRVAFGEFRGEPVLDGKTITRTAPIGTLFRDRADLPLMRVIPGGSFRMGSEDGDPEGQGSERPQRQVNVAGPVAIGVFALTFAEWDCLAPAHKPGDGGFGRGAKPVVNVAWRDAQDWVQRASAAVGERYRLLSEAEWEYGCRAGAGEAYNFSGDPSDRVARFRATAPAEVGSFPPNAFGLYEMHGNVREWVIDLWHDNYSNAPTDALAWTSGHSAMRVVRGGGWPDPPKLLRSAARGRADASERCNFIGFRVAREIT